MAEKYTPTPSLVFVFFTRISWGRRQETRQVRMFGKNAPLIHLLSCCSRAFQGARFTANQAHGLLWSLFFAVVHTEYLFLSWNKLKAEARKQKQNGGIIAQNVLENVSMHLRNTLLANLIDVTLLLIFDNFPLFDETLRHILYCCAFQ